MNSEKNYRISGHESFPCRYAWLPKAVRGLAVNPRLFTDDDHAMVDLGVGKNMVRSIRFWAQVSGVATTAARGAGHSVTKLGTTVLGERGLDPFLEDIRTLWLIHWNISTDTQSPLLAWDFLLNRWHEPEIVPSVVLKALHKEAAREGDNISPVTIDQHLSTFLHTYVQTRGRKGDVQEDNLDCPLVELEFISRVGERSMDRAAGRVEPIYAFRREEKSEITAELFLYFLNDFWEKRHGSESTIHFREVAHGHGSPGQILKLPEEDVRVRVERLDQQTEGFFSYTESTNLQQLRRRGHRDGLDLLKAVYRTAMAHE
jgi:hypothetical protein